jgi:hypothetical protein
MTHKEACGLNEMVDRFLEFQNEPPPSSGDCDSTRDA